MTQAAVPQRPRRAHAIVVPPARIESRVFLIRGQRVMLSTDLAELYQVAPRALVQAVKRNHERFPSDFMFQLTAGELTNLKSQIVISSWGGLRRSTPYAFTEQGVGMLASVLRSQRAIRVNIEIMRTFVRLRKMLASHADLARKLTTLERKYDGQFKVVFNAIRQLMAPLATPSKRPIGFGVSRTYDGAAVRSQPPTARGALVTISSGHGTRQRRSHRPR